MLFQVINHYPIALTGVSLLLAACGLLVLLNRSRQGLRTLLAEYRAVRTVLTDVTRFRFCPLA